MVALYSFGSEQINISFNNSVFVLISDQSWKPVADYVFKFIYFQHLERDLEFRVNFGIWRLPEKREVFYNGYYSFSYYCGTARDSRVSTIIHGQ